MRTREDLRTSSAHEAATSCRVLAASRETPYRDWGGAAAETGGRGYGSKAIAMRRRY
jgi:hypothetical protein